MSNDSSKREKLPNNETNNARNDSNDLLIENLNIDESLRVRNCRNETNSNYNNETDNIRNDSNDLLTETNNDNFNKQGCCSSNSNKKFSTTENKYIKEMLFKLNNINTSNDFTKTKSNTYSEDSLNQAGKQSRVSRIINNFDWSDRIINANNLRFDDEKNNSNSNNYELDKDVCKHVKSIVNRFELENENNNSEIFDKSDQHNNYLSNTIVQLRKPIIDPGSLKDYPRKFHNKERPERSNLNRPKSEIIKPKLLPKPKLRIQSYLHENLFKPIGFKYANGYSFLNCIVQQLYSCADFRKELIEYDKCCNIVDSNADDEIKKFFHDFCKLMDEINNRNEGEIQEYFSKIENFFENLTFENDVYLCFMTILSMMSEVTKKEKIRISTALPVTPLQSFELFKQHQDGFVFDLFYGQMVTKLICSKCYHEFNKAFQLFKSILLSIPKLAEIIPLENVINNYLNGIPVDTDDIMNCLCLGGSKNLYSITEYTHMPAYLFIYLNRVSSYENDEKNNTFISCNEILNFPTVESSIKYCLISVIDHIGDNYGGRYYAKSCFESDQWWMLNDSVVSLIKDKKSIVTKQAIVFLFKKLSE